MNPIGIIGGLSAFSSSNPVWSYDFVYDACANGQKLKCFTLSMEWFRNRMETKVVIEDWHVHYNAVRPHSSLNYQTPNEFKMTLGNYLTIGANFSR